MAGVILAGGCGFAGDDATDPSGQRGISGGAVGTVTAALGEPNGDYPSYAERVVLYASNRARLSPAAEGWPAYPAQPPLQWNLSLNQSSRAHSLDMRDTPCFQHPSCGSTTDDTFARVQMYYTGGSRALGENIAGGPSDGITVVHNWIFEIGAAAGETGHRDNLFSASFNLLGSGYAPGGMPRPAVNNFWTQDFVGTRAAITLPRMTDGIHFPAAAGTGGNFTFGTTYFDASGAAPSRIFVSVDRACTPLTLATAAALPRGTAGKGAYEASLNLASGCHPYYFLATSGTTEVTYPDSGALQVAVGTAAAASCALFAPTRDPAACDGGGSGSGSGGGSGGSGGAVATSGGAGGASGSGGRPGAGGAPADSLDGGAPRATDAGAGDGAPPGAGIDSGGATPDAPTPAPTPVAAEAGCACRVAAPGDRGTSPPSPGWWLAAGLCLAAAKRRRPGRGARADARHP